MICRTPKNIISTTNFFEWSIFESRFLLRSNDDFLSRRVYDLWLKESKSLSGNFTIRGKNNFGLEIETRKSIYISIYIFYWRAFIRFPSNPRTVEKEFHSFSSRINNYSASSQRWPRLESFSKNFYRLQTDFLKISIRAESFGSFLQT